MHEVENLTPNLVNVTFDHWQSDVATPWNISSLYTQAYTYQFSEAHGFLLIAIDVTSWIYSSKSI